MPFLNSPSARGGPGVFPDGRWIASSSNESGRPEIYVRPYPASAGKWQISGGGGRWPVWSRARPELFYSRAEPAADGRVVQAQRHFLSREQAANLVARPFHASAGAFWSYDLHPDGNRFALVNPQGAAAETRQGRLRLQLLRRTAPDRSTEAVRTTDLIRFSPRTISAAFSSRRLRMSLGNVTSAARPKTQHLLRKTVRNWEWAENFAFSVELLLFESGSG